MLKSQKDDHLMVMMMGDSNGEYFVLGHPEDTGTQVWLSMEEFTWVNEQIQEFMKFRKRT